MPNIRFLRRAKSGIRSSGALLHLLAFGVPFAVYAWTRAHVWARAADERGNEAQAWLETSEVYQFTAVAGVRCVEKVLEDRLRGALTPALAFGADFVLEIEGTQRFDALPNDAEIR